MPHPLEVALVKLDDLEVVPEELPPRVVTGVGQQRHADDGLGRVRRSERRLLRDLAVSGPGVDSVHHDILHALGLELFLEDPGVGVHRHLGHGVGTHRPARSLKVIFEGAAMILILEHEAVKLSLREVGVPKALLDVLAGDQGEVAKMGGEVDDPGSRIEHREKGLADILHAPEVRGQGLLHLPHVFYWVLAGLKVLTSVVDQDVNFPVLCVYHVPELDNAVDVRHLHRVVVDHVCLDPDILLDDLVQLLRAASRCQVNVGGF